MEGGGGGGITFNAARVPFGGQSGACPAPPFTCPPKGEAAARGEQGRGGKVLATTGGWRPRRGPGNAHICEMSPSLLPIAIFAIFRLCAICSRAKQRTGQAKEEGSRQRTTLSTLVELRALRRAHGGHRGGGRRSRATRGGEKIERTWIRCGLGNARATAELRAAEPKPRGFLALLRRRSYATRSGVPSVQL
eukprot:SAG22_NODE_131_length_18561_cov_10.941387_2_plen_192_part_00